MKYGRIFDYRNRDEAEIGKRYIFSDCMKYVVFPEDDRPTELLASTSDSPDPFTDGRGNNWQFIREIIDEPELMTNRQLAELMAKGYGEWIGVPFDSPCTMYSYHLSKEGSDVDEDVRVRPWGSAEWTIPTVDIYNDFCHPRCKEDA